MTKPITGVAMMLLLEQGKWQVNDPVSKWPAMPAPGSGSTRSTSDVIGMIQQRGEDMADLRALSRSPTYQAIVEE